jgi:hypothetical protein
MREWPFGEGRENGIWFCLARMLTEDAYDTRDSDSSYPPLLPGHGSNSPLHVAGHRAPS